MRETMNTGKRRPTRGTPCPFALTAWRKPHHTMHDRHSPVGNGKDQRGSPPPQEFHSLWASFAESHAPTRNAPRTPRMPITRPPRYPTNARTAVNLPQPASHTPSAHPPNPTYLSVMNHRDPNRLTGGVILVGLRSLGICLRKHKQGRMAGRSRRLPIWHVSSDSGSTAQTCPFHATRYYNMSCQLQ